MLSGDSFAADTLRNLRAAILSEEIAKKMRETGLDDSAIEQVIAKEIKKRKESVDLYNQNNRPELAEIENKEIDVIKNYLPEQISDQALEQIVIGIAAKFENPNMQMMGQIIGAVKAEVGNTADGGKIAQFVKKQLQ